MIYYIVVVIQYHLVSNNTIGILLLELLFTVKLLSHGNAECCRNVSSHLCFEYVEEGSEPIEIPQYSCLMARSVVQHSQFTCLSTNDCKDSFCLRPSLENNTRLVEINRKQKEVSLFLGHPMEIYKNIQITEFVEVSAMPSSIPDAIRKLCEFLIMISSAFAILNIMPCFYLDGYLVMRNLVNILLSKFIKPKSVRLAVSLSITIIGTFILVLYTGLIFLTVIN